MQLVVCIQQKHGFHDKAPIINLHTLYSLYKKKRKLYILVDNLSPFKDEHFKLAGYLD